MGKLPSFKTLCVFAMLGIGPFFSVGFTVFYRRALQWWYEHQVAMEHDAAEFASWAVLVVIGVFIGISCLIRLDSGDRTTEKHWWWEEGKPKNKGTS